MWAIEALGTRHLGGITPSMAFTASAEALKGDESETTPPIIAWLCNITCPPPYVNCC